MAAEPLAAAPSVDEPLAEMADLAWRLAPQRCDEGRACAPYHRVWPTLRLLGLAADPSRHLAFFAGALAAGGDRSPRSVLVSGAADQGMAALVGAALVGAALGRVTAEITVVDVCPTPLALVEAAAISSGHRIATETGDVRALEHGPRFDVVCTHSLLTMLQPAERDEVVGAWSQVLRPAGRVVTVARIDSGGRSGPGDAETFAEVVRERAASWPGPLPAPPDDLADAADAYARWTVVHPFRAVAELREVMERSGFSAEIRCREVAGGAPRRDLPGGTARRATYAELVATRLGPS